MSERGAIVTLREQCGECELAAEIFHSLSQPLTALEVGLELSLRQDSDVAQLRWRLELALEIAQTLHKRLLEEFHLPRLSLFYLQH